MKKKVYYSWEIPTSVVRMVAAICADYERRDKVIRYSSTTGAVLDRNVELNAAVDSALDEVEVGVRNDILHDISEGIGYNRSAVACMMSKDAYYRRRRKLVHDIAVNLALL